MRQKISPDLIPHTQFHKGIWLLSPSRPHWYYFMKKATPHEVSNNDFLESVDKPLRELVKFLHHKGIKTTPSCAGHHKSEKNFEKIYDALKSDKSHIRNGGLKLKDIETGEFYLYCDKKYVLPWNRETFLHDVLSYQRNGIIGIIIGKKLKIKRRILSLNIKGVTIRDKDPIIFISTSGDDHSIWKKITLEIKKCFVERKAMEGNIV